MSRCRNGQRTAGVDRGQRRQVGWFKLPFFAFVAWLTWGALELYPKTVLRVIDRRNRLTLLTQKCSAPRDAAAAEARLRRDLEGLTVEEFLNQWAPRGSPIG